MGKDSLTFQKKVSIHLFELSTREISLESKSILGLITILALKGVLSLPITHTVSEELLIARYSVETTPSTCISSSCPVYK